MASIGSYAVRPAAVNSEPPTQTRPRVSAALKNPPGAGGFAPYKNKEKNRRSWLTTLTTDTGASEHSKLKRWVNNIQRFIPNERWVELLTYAASSRNADDKTSGTSDAQSVRVTLLLG